MEEFINKEKSINLEKKMEIIYEIIVVGLPLTDEVLMLYYFTKEEIRTLVDNNILKMVKPEKYVLNDTDGLYRYGIKQLLLNHPKYANECFRKCYQLNPNDRRNCLQLSIIELKKRNYFAVYGMLDVLDKIETDKYQKENNLYLYLLNMIARCDENMMDRVFNIKLDDVVDNDFDKLEEINIKEYIMNGKYKVALKLLNDLTARHTTYVTEYMFLKELIIQVITKEQILKDKMLDAAKNKKYGFIINCLERKVKERAVIDLNNENTILDKLSPVEKKVYLITKALINIKESRDIPNVTDMFPSTLDEAIESNNFEEARKINIDYLEYRKHDVKGDIVYLLLEDINEIINEIRDEHNDLDYIDSQEKKVSDDDLIKEIDFDQKLSSIEELAYSLNDPRMSLNDSIKRLGLFKEQALLVKLVYVRDYYVNGTKEDYLKGDILLQEVIDSNFRTEEIDSIIFELKENRDNYKNITGYNEDFNPFVKKRSK